PLANPKETNVPTHTTMTGNQTLIMPSATPPMMIVAGPVTDCAANSFVGLYSSLVEYSVHLPINQPANKPVMTLNATPGIPKTSVPSVRGMSQYERAIAA